MQHNPAHIHYMSQLTPVVPPSAHMTSQWFGLQCTQECTTLPSLPPLAHLTCSQDIAQCPFRPGLQHAHVRVQNTTQPTPIDSPCVLTGHCMVPLLVWLTVHAHKGTQHSLACPHWLTPCVHTTLHGDPVGLAHSMCTCLACV